MKQPIFYTLFLLFNIVNSTYIVTCHNNNECGTVCNRYSSDMIAPTEGLFGTSCKCSSNGYTVHKCNALGYDVRVCGDGVAPSCSTACGQYICIQKDNKKTNGQILSACPKNHPVNTQQCCDHPTSKDYCTCIIQDTLDLNAQPYSALGNTNGYSQSATWGKCGSTLASLDIHINTTRASELVKPFIVSGKWCSTKNLKELPNENAECNNLAYDSCIGTKGCSFCKLNIQHKYIPHEKCYENQEALVLKHITQMEIINGTFKCENF